MPAPLSFDDIVVPATPQPKAQIQSNDLSFDDIVGAAPATSKPRNPFQPKVPPQGEGEVTTGSPDTFWNRIKAWANTPAPGPTEHERFQASEDQATRQGMSRGAQAAMAIPHGAAASYTETAAIPSGALRYAATGARALGGVTVANAINKVADYLTPTAAQSQVSAGNPQHIEGKILDAGARLGAGVSQLAALPSWAIPGAMAIQSGAQAATVSHARGTDVQHPVKAFAGDTTSAALAYFTGHAIGKTLPGPSLANPAAAVGYQALASGALGAGVQAGENVVAQNTYDPQRPLSENVLQNALTFGGFGLLHAARQNETIRQGMLEHPQGPEGYMKDMEAARQGAENARDVGVMDAPTYRGYERASERAQGIYKSVMKTQPGKAAQAKAVGEEAFPVTQDLYQPSVEAPNANEKRPVQEGDQGEHPGSGAQREGEGIVRQPEGANQETPPVDNRGVIQEGGEVQKEEVSPAVKEAVIEQYPQEGEARLVPPTDLVVDPEKYQFREEGAAPPKGGAEPNLYVGWVDEQGQPALVDGHHRLPEAIDAGEAAVPVKFIEAKDADEAKTIGALKNIAEGNATEADATKLFKETGITQKDLDQAKIPIKGAPNAQSEEPVSQTAPGVKEKGAQAGKGSPGRGKGPAQGTPALEGEEGEPGGKFKAGEQVTYTEQGKDRVGTIKSESAPGVYDVKTSAGSTRKIIERALSKPEATDYNQDVDLAPTAKPAPKVDQETTGRRRDLVKGIEQDPKIRAGMYKINGILNGDVDPTESQIKAAQKQVRREMRGTTADLLGGQQIYERMLDKLGLDRDATLSEIADAVRGKIGKIGKSPKETAFKVYSAFREFGKKAADAIAGILHEADAPEFLKHPGEALNTALKSIQKIAAPSTVSKDSLRTNDIMREHQARKAVGIAGIGNSIHKALTRLDALGRGTQNLITDAIEDPKKMAQIKDPELRKFAETLGVVSDGLWDGIKTRGGEQGYLQNYLHMAYKNPESAQKKISEYVASLHGNLGYMMTRRGPKTHAIARELGLEFQENNPARILLGDAANKLKFIFAHDAIQDAINEGLVFEGKPKIGNYVELDPRLLRAYVGKGNFYKMTDMGAKTAKGESDVKPEKTPHFYADPDVARIITNALQPGFQGNPIYELPRFLNNTMNQVELGLSPFHALVISNEIGASMAGIGFRDIAQGNIIKGIKNITTGLTPVLAQAQVASKGAQLRDLIDNDKPIPEDLGGEKFKEYFLAGGGRTRQSAEYVNNTMDQMRISWGKLKDKDISPSVKAYLGVKSIKDVPFAAIEEAMRPVMEYYVPSAKLGIFHAMYMQERPYIPADAKHADIARNAARNWDQVENTMGQLTYENLAWTPKFKQIMMLGLRAVGWKVGSKRAIYGAALDLSRAVPMTIKEISRGVGLTKPTEEQLAKEVEASRGKGDFSPHAQFTQRLGWALGQAAITVSTATALGAINWLYHGKKKSDIPGQAGVKDFVYPRMGKNEDPNANRINTPSYVKEAYDDFLSWQGLLTHGRLGGFGDQLSGAASPLAHESQELITGKDYAGNLIKNQAKNLGSKFLPITAGAGLKELREGGTWGQAAAASLKSGFVQKPKSSHLMTEGQNEILRRYSKTKPPRDQDLADQIAAAHGIQERQLEGKKINEEALADLSPAARKAMRGKGIGEASYQLIGKLPFDDAIDVYQSYLKPDEKVKAFPSLAKAFKAREKQIRVSDRPSLRDQYDKMRDEYERLRDAK